MSALRGTLLALALCGALPAGAVDLWGTVTWNTGAPVAGVELRLVQGGRALPARILTNSAGRYGLYNLSATTSDYTLQVIRSGAVVKSVKLPRLPHGGRVPDIVIS